jgi:hypothetical protein
MVPEDPNTTVKKAIDKEAGNLARLLLRMV